MARAAPGVVRHGTAKDAAAVGVGYTGSGASEHTRQAAHGKGGSHDAVVLGGKVYRERLTIKDTTTAKRNHDVAIAKVQYEMAQVRAEMKTETSPARLERFAKSLVWRQEFLDGLLSQRR